MKKMIVIFAILAMAGVASATSQLDLWITSLNGAPIDPVKEITILESDVINFDIVLTGTPADGTLFSLDADVTATGPGTLDWSQLTEGDNGWVSGYTLNTAIAGGVWLIRVNDAGGNPADPELLVLDHFLLHCDGLGDVFINLSENGSGGGTMTVDEMFQPIDAPPLYGPGLIVHQIPEPMTIALLGLGGLFLLRRRK